MKTRTLTKRPMLYKSFYLREDDSHVWHAAAEILGISQSEFLRLALKEKALRVFESGITRQEIREERSKNS